MADGAGSVNPRDLALPDVATLQLLVARVVTVGEHQSWGDLVTLLATTPLRISEVVGLRVGDVDLQRRLTRGVAADLRWPRRAGTKETKGRRRRMVPIIEPLVSTLGHLVAGRQPEDRLLLGPRGGVITTATLRDVKRWDELVTKLGQPGLVRHGLRPTVLTWMADAGVNLHTLQQVAGHQDPPSQPETRALMCRRCWTPARRSRPGGP